MRLRWGLSEGIPGGPTYRAPYGANNPHDKTDDIIDGIVDAFDHIIIVLNFGCFTHDMIVKLVPQLFQCMTRTFCATTAILVTKIHNFCHQV